MAGLLISILVGWHAFVPAEVSGLSRRGACMPCTGTRWETCPKIKEGVPCTKRALRCTGYLAGDGECFGTTWSPCVPDPACISLGHQSCIGE